MRRGIQTVLPLLLLTVLAGARLAAANGCGLQGEVCCDTNQCEEGLACVPGMPSTCQPCGADGQVCCSPDSRSGLCDQGLGCIGAGNTCAPCGKLDQDCCPSVGGTSCEDNLACGSGTLCRSLK